MTRIENQTFENAVVHIDDNEYVNCIFNNCTFVYSGTGSIMLDGNQISGYKFEFAGAAANTLKMLSVLYNAGFKDLITKTFDNIKLPIGPTDVRSN